MQSRRKLPRTEKPLSIRIPPPLMAQIREAADKMGLSESAVIRLSADIGLEHLRRLDFSLSKAVVDAVEAKKSEEMSPDYEAA